MSLNELAKGFANHKPTDPLVYDMDSRLGPSVTNVFLNVAEVQSVFGLGEVANPGTAHVGYEDDERVVAMIAHGAGHPGAAESVRDRCEFWRTDRSLQ